MQAKRPAGHQLAVKHQPADVVSQSLIIQDKVADRFRQLLALPLAFPTTGGLALPLWRGCPHGLDCVGGSAELVGGNMRHRRRLSRSVRGVPSGSAQLSGRSVGETSGRARLSHRNLTSRPRASQFDGSTRPVIIGLHFLEVVQHMLCAIGRPYRKQAMIGVLQGAAATHSDKPGVSLLW
jgi:hypothetical protein